MAHIHTHHIWVWQFEFPIHLPTEGPLPSPIINQLDYDYVHQLCLLSIYANLSSRLLTVERERAAAHMQGTVFTLARLKIVHNIKNLYHYHYQCVDELSSSV